MNQIIEVSNPSDYIRALVEKVESEATVPFTDTFFSKSLPGHSSTSILVNNGTVNAKVRRFEGGQVISGSLGFFDLYATTPRATQHFVNDFNPGQKLNLETVRVGWKMGIRYRRQPTQA